VTQPLSPLIVAKAYRLRNLGRTYAAIAKELGCSVEGIIRRLDPDYRERRNAYMARYMRRERPAPGFHDASYDSARIAPKPRGIVNDTPSDWFTDEFGNLCRRVANP
jgi:hypothetical protein